MRYARFLSMIAFNRCNLIVAALMAALGTGSVACEVEEEGPPAYGGYSPEYYDGHVVYFDDGGRPFYYEGGGAVWIPASSPFYVRYVNHWHTYGPAYHGWYVHHGYRYRGYHGRGRRR
jgi:hypothetical protein